MTFTVTKPHPGTTYSSLQVIRDLTDHLPFNLEVSGPIPRTDYATTCRCLEVYRVTDESTLWRGFGWA